MKMRKEAYDRCASDCEAIPVHGSAKRCGLKHTPWMGDWFTSWSPRNDNEHAEGTWDHWVDLALMILQDPLTKIVRPEAHRVVSGDEAGLLKIQTMGFYDESNRRLTEEELITRFTQSGDEG